MFILKVTKIFFRNKYREIIYMLPSWSTIWENTWSFSLMLVVICMGLVALAGITHSIGYVMVKYFGMPMGEGDTYILVGFVITILCGVAFLIGYLIVIAIFKFLKWLWKNIKVAINEAKGK